MKTSAETERGQEASAAASREQDDVLGEPSPAQRRGSGLKKIFDKLKRTNSGALLDGAGADASPPAAASGGVGGDDFRRGGVRATAGARLVVGWNGAPASAEPAVRTVKESVFFFLFLRHLERVLS